MTTPRPDKPQLSDRLRRRREEREGVPGDLSAEISWAALRVPFLAVVALAALTRLAYLWEYHRDPTWSLAILDQLYNNDLAKAIASGPGAPAIPYFRPPGYVYFLAMLRTVFPEGFGGIRVVQALVGALGCGLMALLAARLWKSPAAAWVAGCIAAFYGPAIVTDAELLSPVLILPLNALVLLALVEGTRGGRLGWWVAGGVAAGLSAVTRPDILPFLPVALVVAVVFAQAGALRSQVLRGAVVFAACAAVAIMPTAVRNWRVGGEPVLIATSGGVNFHIGNNSESNGLSVILPERTQWGGGWEDFKAMAELETGHPMTWREGSSHFFAKGISTWREHPGAMGGLLLRKLYYFWHGLEVLSSRDDYAARHYSRLAWLTMWPRWVYAPWGLLAPLTLAAIWWAVRRDRAAWLVVAYIAIYWLAVSAFFVTGRFRLPILPAALALSAGLIVAIRDAVGQGKLREFAIPLVIAAIALIALNWPYPGIWKPGTRAQYFYMAGTALQNDGDNDKAIPYLQQAYAEDPTLTDAALFLGDAYREQEKYAEAEQIYRELLTKEAHNGSLELWLGEVLTLQGKAAEARSHLERAVALSPKLFEARMGLGVLLSQQGEMDAAKAQFEAANGLKAHPAVKVMLATFAVAEGKSAEAEKLYREALALEPDNPRVNIGLAEILANSGRLEEARAPLEKAKAADELQGRIKAVEAKLGTPR